MTGRVAPIAVLSRATALWLTLLCAAQAHELRPAVADIEVGAAEIVVQLDVTVEPLIAGIDQSSVADTNDAPEAEEHDRLRALPPEALAAALTEAWPRIAEGFNVTSGGDRIQLALDSVEVPEVGDVEEPRDSTLMLRGPLPSGGAPVLFGWGAEYGALVLRAGDAETGYSGFLTNGDVSASLPRAAAAGVGLLPLFAGGLVALALLLLLILRRRRAA